MPKIKISDSESDTKIRHQKCIKVSHWGNAKQNHKVSLHTHSRNQINKSGKDEEPAYTLEHTLEPSYTLAGV